MFTSVSTLLTAPAGTGKSYWCIYELVEVFLPEGVGDFYSNLPLGEVPETHTFPPKFEGETFTDRIAAYVAPDEEQPIRDRIKTIPRDVLDTWMAGESGPWDYFHERDISEARIVIDEIHNYCPSEAPRKLVQNWRRWCGELRHNGATVLFVTQTPTKLHAAIRRECGLRQALISDEERVDPWFGIKLHYWYQLRAKMLGEYKASFCRLDMADIDGEKRKHTAPPKTIPRDSKYFALYDSYNRPERGGQGKTKHALPPWQRYNWPQLLAWFVKRNAGSFTKPIMLVLFLLAIVFKGHTIMLWFTGVFTRGMATSIVSMEGEGTEEATQVGLPTTEPMPSTRVVTPYSQPANATLLPSEREEFDRLKDEETQRKEEERRRSVLTMITPYAVTLASGETLKVGEEIRYGEHEGRTISKINTFRRFVTLDDGSRLLLGDRWLRYIAAEADRGTVGADGRASQESETNERQDGATEADNDFSGRNPTRFIRTADGGTRLGFDRGRGGPRVATGDSRSAEPNGGRRVSDGSPQNVDADNAYGQSVLSGPIESGR